MCYNCLSANHQFENCTSPNACRTCNKFHHSAICYKAFPAKAKPTETKPQTITSTIIKTSCALPIVEIPLQTKHKGIHKFKALFDQGAQRTLLLKENSKNLQIISRKFIDIAIDGFQDQGQHKK